MKKIAILLAMALVIGTTAWAQSTAAGWTNGLFAQDADSMVNPRFYNPNLGNFLFFSAAPTQEEVGKINMGYATSFGDIYLGIKLSGALLSGNGNRDKGIQEEKKDNLVYPTDYDGWVPESKSSQYSRDIDLSVLVGMANMGFLLGVTIPGETAKSTSVGKTAKEDSSEDLFARQVTKGTQFDLGWGMKGTLAPFVTLSYKFPSLIETVETETADKDNVAAGSSKTTSDSYFSIMAGADYALGEGKTVGGGLSFTNYFPAVSERSVAGSIDAGEKTKIKDSKDTYGGATVFGINAFYKQTVTMETVAISFKPMLGFTLKNESFSWTGDLENKTNFGERSTNLYLNTHVGMKWQVREKVGLYAGTQIALFGWKTSVDTGKEQAVGADGDDKKQASLDARESSWTISGASVSSPTFGLSFTPTENLNIGLSVKPFIEGLFFQESGTKYDFSVSVKF